MIFVVDAMWRRWWACRAQSTRPVFASTRIAAAPASFGTNRCSSRFPPASNRSGATGFAWCARGAGCTWTTGMRAFGAAEAIGVAV